MNVSLQASGLSSGQVFREEVIMFGLSAIKSRIAAAFVIGAAVMSNGSIANAAANSAIQEGQVTGTTLANARYITLSANGKVSMSGFTTPEGEFFYREGEKVSFYIGDILLGTTAAKTQVSAASLVETAKNTDALSNLLRFLQGIDSDGSLENGVQITGQAHASAKRLKVDFDKAMKAFEVQSALMKVLGMATNSPTLPDAVDALTSFRMALLTAYDTNSEETVLNLVKTRWQGTLTSPDCPNVSAKITHDFNILGHVSGGFHDIAPNKKGVCGGASMALRLAAYENSELFSCANGCSASDLNTTVTVSYPTPHDATIIHAPGSNIITIIHTYSSGKEVIETLVKKK